MNTTDLKELLDEFTDRYNRPEFIESDPVSVPHWFSRPEDIEVAGFLSATIAWGNRKSIVRNGHRLMELMDNAPHDFILHHTEDDLHHLTGFVHRTFNATDLCGFILGLKHLYVNHGTLGNFFTEQYRRHNDLRPVLSSFRREFFTPPHDQRTEKHLSCIDKGSACKRINMFLRWMVRRDDRGVDFGLWKEIPPLALYLPLDVHAGNTARVFGLLHRKTNGWKAVEEVTAALRNLAPDDPVRYDYALFGAGVTGSVPPSE